MALKEAIARLLPLIEEALREAVEPPDPALETHYGMMAYHLGFADAELHPVRVSAGKRIRPLLCLLVTEAAGGPAERAMPAAVALELLHNFSLVHDDVEDGSPTRRHRPTVWKVWGIPQAINVGDGMFSLAHLALERLSERDVAPEVVLEALEAFDEACRLLTEGQYLDLAFEARERVSEDEYLQMIAGKTGALLGLSTQLGALVAGAEPAAVMAYRAFGLSVGRAFQIRDDILGIWGDETVTGKSARSDILSRKKSLPVVHALAQESEAGRALRAIYARPRIAAEDVPEILRWLELAGGRAHAEAMVRDALDRARAALAEAQPREPAAAALHELMDVLAERAY